MVTDTMAPTSVDLQDSTSDKVALLPFALPIPFGVNDMTKAKGIINESSIDILDTTIDGGAFWAHCILIHNQVHADKLTRCYGDGLRKIGPCLILHRLLAGQTWGSPSHCRVSVVGDDEEDKAKLAIDALISCLIDITDLTSCSTAAAASVATSTSNLDGLEIDGTQLLAPSIPRKSPTLGADLPSKELPLNKCLHNHTKLANLGWDHTAETIHLHTLVMVMDLLQPGQGRH
jgi:hypothetical protein